jgi:hypothetical protein
VSLRTVILWDFPESDHDAWLAAGCGSGTYAEYRQHLAEQARAAQAERRRLLVVKTSAANVLEAMAKLGLPRTPGGCEAALRRLFAPEEA